ncbi:hypothetical protein ACIQI8_44605 [Streptomyces sp. NPDC092369]|uniref:hypothetical protein n=1 Tax=Streptomyces sp. NPDC092369 TaxID=3366015 RepID=UPI0038210FB3
MIPVPPLPDLQLPVPWTADALHRRHHAQDLLIASETEEYLVRLERCAAGRLRETYPVALHDLELQADTCATEFLPELLSVVTGALNSTDPLCRRLVLAISTDAPSRAVAAATAGFRHVVDVDLGGAEHGLFTWEPSWVTRIDPDLDRVPDV